ncbi:MAG: sulfite exporter TauE/SafE family protein [Magnetococcales bacterium]|nr:sulfite exporter TauE/SafE family protein [Magnetococcales bacterium]
MEVPFAAALLAGLLSFVSPCVLPLVPAYISFMTGVSVDRLRSEEGGALGFEATMHSIFFVLGFSTVFIALGASATYLGQIMLDNMDMLSKAGGVLIVIFGLHYMGLFKISFLNMDARFNLKDKPPGLFGAYMIGLSFAFGWTPCVGPILATILTMAGGQDSVWQGISLLTVYSLGLGIPFILAGVAINSFFGFFIKIRVHLNKIEMVSGALLVVVGVLIFMGDFSKLSIIIIEWFPALATIG